MSDDFSSNINTSGAIAINGFANGNIEVVNDHDWFRVHLTAGVSYRFSTNGGLFGAISDTTMQIFDAAGNSTGFFNDDANTSFFSELFFTPRTTADYFVDVGGFGTHVGTYQVSASIDDFAAGTSTTGQLTVTNFGNVTPAIIDEADDHDWFRVSLEAGVTYRFDVNRFLIGGVPALNSSFMRLYDGLGTVQAFDAGVGGTSLSEIMFTPSIAGNYFVEVSSNDGLTGSYAVSAHTDDFQSGLLTDSSATPRFGAVTVNGLPALGMVESEGDHDWFAVDLVAGTRYRIVGNVAALNLRLFDSNGRSIDGLDLSNFAATYTGTYYVDASATGRGSYAVSVTTANATNDFNGDGRGDILWRNSNGTLSAWQMNGGTITAAGYVTSGGVVATPGATWSIAGISDFSGDGNSDVLWRNTDGTLDVWNMNGTKIVSSGVLEFGGVAAKPDASWSVVGTGDFDGDSRADILWRNTNGTLVDWSMNGSTILSGQLVTSGGVAVNIDASWSVAGIGDFNGDNKRDVLWHNTSGTVAIWEMNGSEITSGGAVFFNGAVAQPDASWSIAGVGDFNGDGNSDILWRNTNGSMAVWQMDGTTIASSGYITFSGIAATPDATWHVVEIGDFNGDRNSDILWRNDNGAMSEWLMNGATIVSSTSPTSGGVAASPDASWHTQAKSTNFA